MSNEKKINTLSLSSLETVKVPMELEDVDVCKNEFPSGQEELIAQDHKLSLTEISMLERLSQNANVVAKSQQRGDPDLSVTDKFEALKTLYTTSQVQFLSKFESHLQIDDCKCFENLRKEENYEAIFHLEEIEKAWKKGSREKQLKNRRYEALKKLVETTDYFSEEEMQRRNPILFEQLIGKYHTSEEREAFLQQSWKSTSGGGTSAMPLTDLFLAHLERTPDGISCRRLAQETQQEEEDDAEAEYDSDEICDMESPKPSNSREKDKRSQKIPCVNEELQPEEIEDDEKELLKEEFFTTMYRNFLNGKDEDFDYTTVDDNPEYDCGEDLENDEEDKYFDDEEPCEVSEPNSDQDELFKPPIRSGEIESKIESLSMNSNIRTDEKSNNVQGEDEDELDIYMKEIEKQLGK